MFFNQLEKMNFLGPCKMQQLRVISGFSALAGELKSAFVTA